MEEPIYSPTDLRDLIESALLAKAQPESESTQSILFSYGDTKLLEVLSSTLDDYLPHNDTLAVLDRLRTELYANVGSTDIKALHTIIKNHKVSGTINLPYWNVTNPDIVFVSTSPPRDSQDNQAFINLLKEVGFSSDESAWTFLIRSPELAVDDLSEEEKRGWGLYLYSEIRIWRPRLICTIGSVPTNLLLGHAERLGDRVGSIHWVGPWAIMPIYSIDYAIKSNKLKSLKQFLEQAHSYCTTDR